MSARRLLIVLLIASLLLSSFGYGFPVSASPSLQDDTPESLARALLETMTPEERVGQLFIVNFIGSKIDKNSQIYDLVTNRHIGGVVLLTENDNFIESPDTVNNAYQLISSLQMAEWDHSQAAILDSNTKQIQYHYIPLLIGIIQDGGGYPHDQILSGITTLPGLMALGATWDPEMAFQTGAVAGAELSSIGFNLYLGPSLDVLEYPSSSVDSSLGSTVFGGDPYWVGLMGQSYISGLHSGSDGRMAVVAKNFPGRGSADRPSGGEVATVRKSLEQLKQIELAPFIAVTGNASPENAIADGLLVSHIRYQGFQGNIRATTRPVSFDSQAFAQILSLPYFISWRNDRGGLMVSDDLGSDTVRKFYDPTEQSFSARLVARDAFLAGNDLLYLGDVVSTDQPDNYSTVIKLVEFFTQKYLEDTAFAERVDESAMRVLTLKYRLYNDFSPESVLPSEDGLTNLGKSENITFNVARSCATLISPDIADLATVLPSPPSARERIIYFTDTLQQKQCASCYETASVAIDSLQSEVLRLYGPQGVGLVYANRMLSYSFSEIPAVLQGGAGNSTLEYDLRLADWIVISLIQPGETGSSGLLSRFLSERQDLLRDKKIIVFTFEAPYYLDATDISKLTAYYGLYSKSPPFIEIAARVLFQEINPTGVLPVSVPGIGYDLLSATAPDPGQIINLILGETTSNNPSELFATSTASPGYRIGDTITIRTGVIFDHNGHHVPDGTEVQFTITQNSENAIIQQVGGSTSQGVATASIRIDRAGLLEIRANSEPAMTSVVIRLDVTADGMTIVSYPPTIAVDDLAMTPEIPSATTTKSSPFTTGHPGLGGWFVMLFMLVILGYMVFLFAGRLFPGQWNMRWAICLGLGGVTFYLWLAVNMPGANAFLQTNGYAGIIMMVFAGSVTGLLAGIFWYLIYKKIQARSNK